VVYEQQIRVRYAETGIGAKLKPVEILNYFQDVASEHCRELGISAIDLLQKNLAWVVFRYDIDIKRYPSWNQVLTLRTRRYPDNNLYELRHYEIIDEAGRVLICGKSCWILTRLDTGKPVRLNKHLPYPLCSNSYTPIDNSFPEILPLETAEYQRSFTARMHDLDFNRHVNNASFILWAMESVPIDIAGEYRPAHITVHFIGEALFGETITVRSSQFATNPHPRFIHVLTNPSGKEITRVMTHWRDDV